MYPGAPAQGSGAAAGPRALPGQGEGTDIRQYIGIVLSRWWLILLFLLLGAGAGFAYIYTRTPLYRAKCRIEVVQDPRLTFADGASRAVYLVEQEVTRRCILLQSGLLNREVRDGLIDDYRDKLPEGQAAPIVTVTPMHSAQTMLDVSVDAPLGEYALAYLTLLLEKYETNRSAELVDATNRTLRSLRDERDKVSKELETAQGELAKFLADRSFVLNEAKAKGDDRLFTSLIQRQNALRLERDMLQVQDKVLDRLSVGTVQEVLDLTMETREATQGRVLLNSGAGNEQSEGAMPIVREQADWQTRELELARLEAQYAEELKIYKPGHPKIRVLMVRIEGVKRDLKLTAEMAIKRLNERKRAVEVQLDALDDATDNWSTELKLSAADRAAYQTLGAKVEHLQKLHDVVFQRVVEGSVLNVDAVYKRNVESPALQTKPIWPNNMKVMLTSIAVALALAIGLALLLHTFDSTLLDIGIVEERFGITYISGIPHWGRLLKAFTGRSNSVIVTREKANVATEVYRTVRGTLEHVMGADKGAFALAITSSDSGDGKSLTALNLAVVFAWTGKRVLLIDGDLRRGALHKALGVESEKGFTEVLTGSVADWHSVVRKGLQENLDFISSGQYVQESPEQLGSQRMRDLLRQWRESYDLVVFDTAPVSRVMDTAVMARYCDGVLLVARFGKTRMAELQHLLRRLEGTRVLGFCVNCIDFHKLSRSYYGYSGYSGYGYGYRDYGYGYYRYYSYYQPYGERKKKGESVAVASPPAASPPT